MYYSLSQEKCGPSRLIIYDPELMWVLCKMYEHDLTFDGRENMSLWVFNQRNCYIEVIKFHQ